MKSMLKALGLVLLLALSAFLGYEVFKVRTITVQGAQLRPASDVVALSGISYGQSMFRIDEAAARERIDANAYYDFESLTLDWPNTVVIQVNERRPVAYLLHLNTLLAIDGEGIVLELYQNAASLDAPVVTGLQVSSFVLGKRLAVSEEGQLEAMEAILVALEEANYLHAVSEINVTNVMDLKLITAEGIVCLLGTTLDVDSKIGWIQAVVPKVVELFPGGQASGQKIDVSSGNDALLLGE